MEERRRRRSSDQTGVSWRSASVALQIGSSKDENRLPMTVLQPLSSSKLTVFVRISDASLFSLASGTSPLTNPSPSHLVTMSASCRSALRDAARSSRADTVSTPRGRKEEEEEEGGSRRVKERKAAETKQASGVRQEHKNRIQQRKEARKSERVKK